MAVRVHVTFKPLGMQTFAKKRDCVIVESIMVFFVLHSG